MHLRNYAQKQHSAVFKISVGQLNLEGQREIAVSEKCSPSMYQTITEGQFMFFQTKHSNSSELCYLELGFYPFLRDILETMNKLIQETQSDGKLYHSQSVSMNAKSWDSPRKLAYLDLVAILEGNLALNLEYN